MILDLRDLAISFGDKAVLRGVGFSIAAGEAVALMGPNGAGKTTVLRCVLGLLRYAGTITVAGFDADRQGVQARARIGYVPQSPAFYDLSAREVVRLVARLRGVRLADPRESLARVGLAEDADRAVRTFSGGMQQRLSLAAALIGDPPVLLLDEPTANLDAEARERLLELLSAFHGAGKTLLLSSHRPQEVRGLVDRVVLLREGKVERDGLPGDVLPTDRLAVRVVARDADRKAEIGVLLAPHGVVARATPNGTFEGILPATACVAVVERLRNHGVGRDDIHVEPVDEGGLS